MEYKKLPKSQQVYEKLLKRVQEWEEFQESHNGFNRMLIRELLKLQIELRLSPILLPLPKRQKNNQPEPSYQKIIARLPEEYRSDFFQLRKRWQKKGLSVKEIKYLTYKHLIHIILGLIQIKIQNILLFRYSSNKDN